MDYDYYYNQRNTSNQLNPNNDAFWKCRGYSRRPNNWKGNKNNILYIMLSSIVTLYSYRGMV